MTGGHLTQPGHLFTAPDSSRLRGMGVKPTFPTLVEAKGRMELQGVWVQGWPEPRTGGGADERREGELNG